MSKLEELIQKLCPNGVEYRKLGSIATEIKEKNKDRSINEVRTVTNKSKLVRTSDFFDRDITSEDTSSYKVVREDMFVYNPSRINIGSIAYSTEKEPVILSPMYVVFSVPKTLMLNEFLMLYFKSNMGMHQIVSKVEPGARFRLPFESLSKIRVPVPPMRVQHEIVRILNNFSELAEELTKELTSRKQQYEYYCDKLLAKYCPSEVEYKELGEVCKFSRGKSLSREVKGLGETPIILYGELYTTYGNYIREVISHTSFKIAQQGTKAKRTDILMPITSTTKEAQIGKASTICVGGDVYIGGDAIILSHEQDARYLVHVLNSGYFEKLKMQYRSGTTVSHLSPTGIAKIKIPVPKLEIQNEIARILDTFTELTSEIMAELVLRKKQYECYQNKLLTL